MGYITYIEKETIKGRGCHTLSYQVRKIYSFLNGFYKISNNIDESDIVILLSCIVVPYFINENYKYIDKFLKSNKKVILYGCLSEKIKKAFLKRYGKKIYIINHEEEYIFNNIYPKININFGKTNDIIFQNSNVDEFINSNYHLVVGKGCKHNCSFCITREGKKILSYYMDDIYEKMKGKFNNGIKHFRLTSDDLSTYGIDTGENLFNLINKILDYDKSITLELGPIYPEFILLNKDKFLEILYKGRITKIFSAIQHREGRILKLMNRIYNHKLFEKFIHEIKLKFPKIELSTHLIYGYPTETDREFISNLKNIKYFDTIQFYRYSKNYKMDNSNLNFISSDIILKRKNIIINKFTNIKGLKVEFDNTKIVVMKNINNGSYFKKYF